MRAGLSAALLGAVAVGGALAACSNILPPVDGDGGATVAGTIDDASPDVALDANGAPDADAGAVADASADSAALADGPPGPVPDSSEPLESLDASTFVDCADDAGGAIGPSGAPGDLACTGLYADWGTRAIAADVVAYDPGLHLWSDGATKQRWIRLPPGAQIDTSNMDEWTFPVGTKVWKEFALGGARVETRYLTKRGASDWVWTTYQWSADGSSARELTTGATNVNGSTYEIPTLDDCRVCHMGRLDVVLGFEAISLSSPAASGVTMSDLVARGSITNAPAAPLVIPGDATESAALGWLHANCGNACHNPSTYSLAGSTGFFMRLSASKLSSVQATDTWTTGVNVKASFTAPDGGALLRIAPGDPAGSCVVFRDSYRDTQGEGIQMPPLDTHVVDTSDVQVVSGWILEMN